MNRETILVGVGCLLALLAGGWLFFVSTIDGPRSEKATPVPFAVLHEGSTSGDIVERKNYLIESPEELAVIWDLVYGPTAPAVPAIDFSNEEVLAVFDGTHSSGGYSVLVSEIKDTGLTRSVQIVHQEPEEGCMTTEALTSPFQMVIVPKSDATIARTDITASVACQ